MPGYTADVTYEDLSLIGPQLTLKNKNDKGEKGAGTPLPTREEDFNLGQGMVTKALREVQGGTTDSKEVPGYTT